MALSETAYVVIKTSTPIHKLDEAAFHAAGAFHRDASIEIARRHKTTGVVVVEQWKTAWLGVCKLHRCDGPAVVMRDPKTRVVTLEKWYQHGRLSRSDGPAFVLRDRKTGMIVEERWYTNQRLNRKDGPAVIHWDAGGNVELKRWYQNGRRMPSGERVRRHRPTPP